MCPRITYGLRLSRSAGLGLKGGDEDYFSGPFIAVFFLGSLGAGGSLLGWLVVTTALAFYQERYLTAYHLLFQTQVPTTTLAWVSGRAARRNQPDEGTHKTNLPRKGCSDPQWVLLAGVETSIRLLLQTWPCL